MAITKYKITKKVNNRSFKMKKEKNSVIPLTFSKISCIIKIKQKEKEETNMITKTEIVKSFVDKKRGWAFKVYFNDLLYPSLISALYKTKKETIQQLNRYIETGDFDFYGSAE